MMAVNVPPDQLGSAGFSRSVFILRSLGFAALVAGFSPQRLRLLGTATAATAVDGCGWIPWQMATALPHADFRAMHDELQAEGYRLARMSCYDDGGLRLTGIWEFQPSAERIFAVALSQTNFRDRNRTHQQNGYRLLAVDGFSIGGVGAYSGIWEKAPGSPKFGLGMTATGFRQKVDELVLEGYRLRDVSGFELNGRSRFAALWRKDVPSRLVADIEMSEADFDSRIDALASEGLLPVDVSAYEIAGATRYAAIWTEFSSAIGVKALLDSARLDLESDERRYRGQRPVMVDAYPRGGQTAYTTIWRRDGITEADENELADAVEKHRADYDIPGLSLAFAKNGRLVYARAFGWADPPYYTTPVTIHHRFRIGSASKPITATAIMRLVEDTKLSLEDTVFGDEGILGTTYGTSPYRQRLRRITVQHLLEHTAGWPNPTPDNGAPDIMGGRATASLDREQLIDHVIDNSGIGETYDLLNRPGTVFGYSGFGYLLLTKIIEAKTGMSDEDFVNQYVIDDPDSTLAMASQTDTPLENEVSYYEQGGSGHSNFAVWRRAGGGGRVASAIDLVRFMTRVDREHATRADVIDQSLLERMIVPSAASETAGDSYGWGWAIDKSELPAKFRVDYGHGGRLSSTNSVIACKTGDDESRYCWAAIINTDVAWTDGGTPEDPSDDDPGSDLDAPMRKLFAMISEWPCLDLF